MANLDGLVVSLRSSRALARRTHPFLTERGRELGADTDDCASSEARAPGSASSTAASASERKRAHAFAEAAEHAGQVLSIASLVAQAAELRARRVTVR
jgi:hypothetical protein